MTETNYMPEYEWNTSFIGCNERDVVSNFSAAAKRFYVCLIFLSCVATLATCAANSLFIAVMIRHWMRIRAGQKLLMVLSAADVMQGVSTWPIQIYFHSLQLNGQINCTISSIRASLGYGLAWTTALSIFVISLEKYIAIAFPYTYELGATFKRFFLSIFLPSLLNMIASFVLNVWFPQRNYRLAYKKVIALAAVVLVIGMGFMQGHVTFIANRTRKRISEQNSAEGKAIQQRGKAMKSAMLILSAFLLAYIPFVAYITYTMVTKDSSLLSRTFVKPTVELFALSNSMMNPFVYYLSSKKIRQLVKPFVFGKSQVANSFS